MITIKRLSFDNAKELLQNLNAHFGLVYANDFCAHGNTISAQISRDQKASEGLIEDRYIVEVKSNYFVDSSLKEGLGEYNDSFFLD